jgi:hypothetical protein
LDALEREDAAEQGRSYDEDTAAEEDADDEFPAFSGLGYVRYVIEG